MHFKAICILLLLFQAALAQDTTPKDSVNNLVLPRGTMTCMLGSIPSFTMSGMGKQSMILIHGIGFDGSVFNDFPLSPLKRYRIYTVTIPGFGGTSSPPLPAAGTSYGEQVWSHGAVEGIRKLIQKENLSKPVLVGHFTMGVQLAMRFALLHPDLIGGVILIGGPSKFISVQNGKAMEYSLDFRIKAIDGYMAPKFYKTIRKEVFDENNYLPDLYSNRKELARELWIQPTKVLLPVMIQYLCEFFASDLTGDFSKTSVPALVIRPGFTRELLSQPDNPNVNYIRPQFIDGWDVLKGKNEHITIQDIEQSGVFAWKDQPEKLNQMVIDFLKRLKR
ncbi:MAG: alpha/beta hydrolase [Cyclobacteriaceae bacterium]|nr:alpha/beta hydrolase [Cyclobacteriaceae bacterium]